MTQIFEFATKMRSFLSLFFFVGTSFATGYNYNNYNQRNPSSSSSTYSNTRSSNIQRAVVQSREIQCYEFNKYFDDYHYDLVCSYKYYQVSTRSQSYPIAFISKPATPTCPCPTEDYSHTPRPQRSVSYPTTTPSSTWPTSTIQPLQTTGHNSQSESASQEDESQPTVQKQHPQISLDTVGSILFQNSTQLTFVSSNRSEEKVNVTRWRTAEITHVIQMSQDYKSGNYIRIQDSSHTPPNTMPSMGFVQSVVEAYKYHHSLILRPDDVWTAIITQLSLYINGNGEGLRGQFVNHTGRLTLRVDVPTDLRNVEYASIVQKMKRKIDEKIRPEFSDWLLGNFSTSTSDDYITKGFILMASMQQYFNYEVGVACGIPKVTLLGTIADWRDIQTRIGKLSGIAPILKKWHDTLLRPILNKFVEVKEGVVAVDTTFWGDICRVHDHVGGYDNQNIGHVDGWITAFTAFDVDGVWMGDIPSGGGENKWPRISIARWAPGTVMVPLKIKKNFGTEFQQSTIFAGHMGHIARGQGYALQPYSGWAIGIKG